MMSTSSILGGELFTWRALRYGLGSSYAAARSMLAKSGPLPDGPEWRFELKLDGFRAIVSTTGGLRVRSRRG